jgi:hypothetical protein
MAWYQLYDDKTVPEIAELKELPRAECEQISARAFIKAFQRPRGFLGAILVQICMAAGGTAAGALSGFDKSWWEIVPASLGVTIGGLVGFGLFMILIGPLYLACLRQELQARQGTAATTEHGEPGRAVSLTDSPTLPPDNKPPMPWFGLVRLAVTGGLIGGAMFVHLGEMVMTLLRPLDSTDPAWQYGISCVGIVLGALLFLWVGKR